jgi:hypothetical protein
MLRVFNHRCAALGLPSIPTQNLRDVAKFVEVVERSVTASILAVEHLTATVLPGIREGEMKDAAAAGGDSSASSSHAAGVSRLSSAHRLLKSFTLIPTMPSWRLEKSFLATVFKLDIRSLTPEQMWGDEQLPMHKRRGTFKIASQPFAQGSERLAYYALNLSFTSEDKVDRTRSPSTSSSRSSSRGRRRSRTREDVLSTSRSRSRAVSPAAAVPTSAPKSVVLKEYKYRGKGWNKLARYLGHMEVQSVAAKLAQEFATAGGCAPGELKFVKATVIGREDVDACTGAVTHTYWACEPMVEGSYVKYNNNVGWVRDDDAVADDPTGSGRSELLQTFSHFTYDFSGGHLCVVDLQGVNLLLTDPAIHCTNLLRFGRTNLGLDGMARFFRTHKCGELCKKMNLKPFRVPEKVTAAIGLSASSIAASSVGPSASSRRRESVSRAA